MLDGYRAPNVYRTSEKELEAWMRSPSSRASAGIFSRKRPPTPQLVETPGRPEAMRGPDYRLPLAHVNRSRKQR